MLDSEFLICDRRASARQVQLAQLLALLLLLCCVAIFPYRAVPLPRITALVCAIDAVHFLFGGITAAILLSLASILRSKALVVLGAGFFVAGILAVEHALTYPNLFSATGLLGANGDTATWIYLAWHIAFPAAVIGYVLLKTAPFGLREPARTISVWLMVTILLAAGIMLLATAGTPFLVDLLKVSAIGSTYIRYLAMSLTAIGIALLLLEKRSVLDVGLMLTLWALLTESVVILPDAGRFSLGWYAGRVMGLLSGLFVLQMLLIDMSRLYGRMVILTASRTREKENRLMVGEAVGAFIAHELRQPLASMLLNAGTAKQLCHPDDAQLSTVLDELIEDGRMVNQIIESTRATVGRKVTEKSRTDINQLIRDTLRMTDHDRRSRGIEVELRLDDHQPFVIVNPLQMKQVFVNLLANAADAVSEVKGRPRIITVQSGCGDSGVMIRVKDSGTGIKPDDRERIFDAFFTTKEHGAGMGLSICRSVLKAHGGTIRVSCGDPFGTVFEICLPLESAAASLQAMPAEKTAFSFATDN